MTLPLSLPRLALAMLVAGVAAAMMLALALSLIADGERGIALPNFVNVLVMGLFFCFFTVPIAALFALPAGWLWQRFGPFRWWNCALIGAVCGVMGGYGFLRLVFVPTIQWPAALWFGVGGSAAGLALGLIMGQAGRAPKPSAASQG